MALAVLGILIKILLDREEKRKKLVAEIAARKNIFPLWKLAPGLLESTTTGNLFFNLLNKLRRRTPDDFYRLNIPKTVDHTVKKAGMVEFQYDVQTRPPEYILLVDGASHANHLSKLFELLVGHFKANEVYIERFFLHPENELCYNEAFPNGMPLAALQERFYNSKLLLLAAAYEPQEKFFAKLSTWQNTFDNWEDAALLLPVPVLAKASLDHNLQEVFTLVPATLEGIDHLLEQQTGRASKVNRSAEEVRQLSEEIAGLERDFVPFLAKYFSPTLLTWVAGCAIYPSLHWSLTTRIGQLLTNQEADLLSLENLFGLTTIPWFINGEIPESARAELIDHINQTQPGLYDRLNSEIANLLQNETLFDEATIEGKHEAIVGVDETVLEKALERPSVSQTENFATTGTTKSAEIPVITKLDRKEGLLDFLIPKKWKQDLKHLGFPNLGRNEFWKDVLKWALPIFLLTLAFLYWLPEKWDNCDGELVEYVYKEKPITLCITTPEERILLHEYLARDAIQIQNEKTVDSLRSKVAGIVNETVSPNTAPVPNSALDTAVQSFYGNVSVEYFNRGVKFYNDFLQSNIGTDKGGAISTLKTEACYHFNRAYVFDSLDVDMQNAVEWCLKDKEPKTIDLQGKVVHATDQTGLANAKVTYESQETVTDSLGQFTFSVPTSIDSQGVTLVVTKLGFLEKTGDYLITKVDSNLFLNTPISLDPDPALMERYVVNGNIIDTETKQAPSVPIKIYTEEGLETIAENGQFSLDIAEGRLVNNSIKFRFEGRGYQTIIQEVTFDIAKEISIDIQLEPVLSDNFKTVAMDDIDLDDSLDYLLNRILELGEAPTAINFDIARPKMEFIEGSTFAMGDVMGDGDNSEATHVVTLSSFYIGAYEVTFEEFDLFCEFTNKGLIGDAGWGRGRYPAFQVSWYDAIEYCNWLSEQLGYDQVYTIDKNRQDPNNKSRQDRLKWTVTANWEANGFRLPTEAEWEYAARQGGEKVRFGNGKNEATPAEINYAAEADSRIDYLKSGENRRKTVEVGSLPGNSEGLYEMSGNVPEWCWDWLGDYPEHGATNPTGAEFGAARVLRGGSFGFPGKLSKVSTRYSSLPTRVNGLGFRLCRGAK